MSCGRIALDQLGIPVEKYYASEIDKYAMQVSAANYPDIEQVGDVCNLDPKDFKDVNLILFGSPCQGFSFAGKQLAFDDPRSKLFFEAVRLLKAIKPKYFLAENVRMKKEFLEIFTEQLSQCYEPSDVDNQFLNVLNEVRFEPIFINSSLLSAQSRQRYYWTNIPGIKQPEDRGIVLRDILETEPNNFTKMSDKFVKRNGDRNCMIDQNKEKASNLSAMEYVKNGRQGNYLACDDNGKPVHKTAPNTERAKKNRRNTNEKSFSLTATMHKGAQANGMTLVPQKPIKVGMNVEEVKVRKHKVDILLLQQALRAYKQNSKKTNKQIADETNMPITKVEHWFRTDNSFAIPSDDIWFKLKEVLGFTSSVFDKQIMEFEYRDGVFESTQRVYSDQGKSPTLTASNKEQMIETKPKRVGTTIGIKGHDILKRVYGQDGKSPTITAHAAQGSAPKIETKPKKAYDIPREILKDNERQRRVYDPSGKSPTVLARSDSPKITTPKQVGKIKDGGQGNRIYSQDGKSSTLSAQSGGTAGNGNTLVETKPKQVGIAVDINGHDILKRVYSPDGKSPTVNTCQGGNREPKVVTGVHQEDLTWRKLTPLECERLQTVPDNYTNHVSNTQRYKMLGNGWTVEVIKHILQEMEYENDSKS